MGRIFQNARCVTVWLGRGKAIPSRTNKLLHDVSKRDPTDTSDPVEENRQLVLDMVKLDYHGFLRLPW